MSSQGTSSAHEDGSSTGNTQEPLQTPPPSEQQPSHEQAHTQERTSVHERNHQPAPTPEPAPASGSGTIALPTSPPTSEPQQIHPSMPATRDSRTNGVSGIDRSPPADGTALANSDAPPMLNLWRNSVLVTGSGDQTMGNGVNGGN